MIICNQKKGRDTMDIMALSTSYQTSLLLNEVSIAVMDNVMEQAQIATDGMVKALESSVTPHLGQNIDVSI